MTDRILPGPHFRCVYLYEEIRSSDTFKTWAEAVTWCRQRMRPSLLPGLSDPPVKRERSFVDPETDAEIIISAH